MQGAQRVDRFVAVDQRGDFNVARRDHFDINIAFGQRVKHFLRDARSARHSEPDDRNFRDVFVDFEPGGVDFVEDVDDDFARFGGVFALNGERNVRFSLRTRVLRDHIGRDFRVGELREDFHRRARFVRNAENRDASFVFRERDAANRRVFAFRFRADDGARRVAETAANVNQDAEFFREFDRTAVHNAGAEAR